MRLFNLEITKKTKEEIKFPTEFGLIELNNIARLEGVDDDFNKKIVIYVEGKAKKEYPYTEEMIQSLKEQGIPVETEITTDEEFDFDSISTFGGVLNEK